MPYSIETKDGIVINNIPDNVKPDDESLKNRVKQIRESLAQVDQAVFSTEPEGLPAEVKREQAMAEMKPKMSDAQRQAEIDRLTEKQQDPLRYAAKQGKTDVSQEDVNMLSDVLAPTAMQPKPAAPQPEPAAFTVGEATPAPDLQSQQLQKRFEESRSVTMKPLREKQEEEVQKIDFKDLSKKDEYFEPILAYGKSRFGEAGELTEGETKEEYIERFATHMRMLDTGNLISATQEQEWLNGADPKDVVAAGKAYNIFSRTGSFYEAKGQSGFQPYLDFIGSIITDPSTLLSLGVAKGAALALRTTGKKAPAFFIPATEGGTAALSNTLEQKRDIAVADQTAKQMQALIEMVPVEQRGKYQEEIDRLNARVEEGVKGSEVATSGAFGATFGLIEPLTLLSASRKANLLSAGKGDAYDLTLKDVFEARKVQENLGIKPGQVVGNEQIDTATQATTPFTPLADSRQIDMFDAERGRALLDQQGEATAIAEMQVKNSIGKQATLVAEAVWKQMPELSPQKTELTSDAVIRTLGQISDKDVPSDVIESAFIKSGVDFEEFTTKLMDAGFEENILKDLGSMYGESVSDAARTLQSLSVISRMQNKAKQLDPAVVRKIQAFYNPETDSAMLNSYFAVKDFLVKADKNMIVAMTSNSSTLVRNAFGMALNGTYGMGAEAIESVVFSVGKSLAEKASGVPVTGSIGSAARNATKDSLGLFFYLNEPVLTAEVTQKALENSPALMSKLLVTAEELKKSDLYKPVQILNTPAMMLDKFVRQAVFTASLEKQLRRQGLDVYEVMADGKNIPIEVLRKSVDDALAFTFSKHPTNQLLSLFVKGVDHLRPISSLAFPFARFMANSVEWTYTHYNPGRLLTGAFDISQGVSLAKAGKMDDALGIINKGSKKIGDAAVGLATFLGAYNYRSENQDLSWNEWRSDDGTIGDLKYLFPANIPFAMADFWIKMRDGRGSEFKVRELVDALIGYKSSAGTQNWMLDKASEVFANVTGEESDEILFEKMETLMGEVFGQFFGRAFVPLNQISDVIAAYDRDESIPRDAYVYREGEEKDFTTAAKKQMQKLIPFWKQALPEYQPATREVAPYRDSGMLKQITGVAIAGHKNNVEKEIQRLNLEYLDVYRPTGDRTLDSQARKIMASTLPFSVSPILDTDAYKNAERRAQALMLKNALGEAQRTAKKYATDLSVAEAYEKKQVPEIMKRRYMALDERTKNLVNQKFKSMTGVSLSESTDFTRYEQALELAKIIKKNPEVMQRQGFAVGGAVTKGVKKALKIGAKSAIKKESFDLLQEMQDLVSKKADDVVPPKPAAVTPDMTEQAIPTTPKSVAAPEPTKLAEDVDPSDWERATAQAYGFHGGILDELKELHPKQYENTVWQQYQNIKDPTGSWKYENRPHKDVGDIYDFEDEEGLIEFGAKDMKKQWADENEAELSADIPPIADDPALVVFSDKALYGPLKSVKNVYDRSDLIAQIKYARSDAFSKLNKAKDFAENDDIVLGVAQGEFRNKFKVEFDPEKPDQQVTKTVYNRNTKQNEQVTTTAAEAFKDEVKQQQSRLDRLRDKYKDTPPVTLYHGAGSRTMPKIKSTGFINPAKVDSIHSELNVPSTSMTRDLNLNFRSTRFGGKSPENYVSVDMPYADYAFSKVNMSIKDYENADLDTIVRAISGDPRQARPVSLPRGTMLEKEDAILEPEKLMINKKPEMGEKIEKYTDYESKRVEQQESLKEINDDINKVKRSLKLKEADIAYKALRDYLKTLRQAGDVVSTKGGMGHQYQQRIESIPMSTSNMLKIADALEKSGSTERASLVRKLRDIKQDLADSQTNPTGKIMQRALDLSTKFNKGGLAVRK